MSIVASIEDSTILRPPIDRAYAAGEAKGKGEVQARCTLTSPKGRATRKFP